MLYNKLLSDETFWYFLGTAFDPNVSTLSFGFIYIFVSKWSSNIYRCRRRFGLKESRTMFPEFNKRSNFVII
jgi:hypothetical protein